MLFVWAPTVTKGLICNVCTNYTPQKPYYLGALSISITGRREGDADPQSKELGAGHGD